MLDIKKLGKKIRTIRKELGLSQTEFGKKLGEGITFNTVARWERGEVEISTENLYRIKKAFNVKLDELLP